MLHSVTEMDVLGNPWMLALSIVLGAASFILLTAGLKTRNLTWALWGVALGAPSYAPDTPAFWAFGAVIAAFAWKSSQV
jgi:hypothetical protein